MARACPTSNGPAMAEIPWDSRPCRQGAGAASPMPKVGAASCAVRTEGVATPLVLAAVTSARSYPHTAQAWEPEGSVDLNTELAVNEALNGGVAEALPWVTDHGNQVACE